MENLGDRFIGDSSYVIGHPLVLDIDHGRKYPDFPMQTIVVWF